MYSVNIVKESATGERIVLEACSINRVTGKDSLSKDELWEATKEICAVADDRMQEMNERTLGAYGLLDMLEMNYRIMFTELLDIISGRQTAQAVAHRWISRKEENEALAKGREEALAARLNGEENAETLS